MNREQQTKEARRQVLHAVLCLPGSLGVGCATALLQAPAVVEKESDPALFLLHEQSVSRAALKLAIYWNRRVAIFGQRAFLPMNDKTGVGALTPQDINGLDYSCLHPLPRDQQGHAVFLVDFSKVTSYTSATGIRGLFFQLQQQTESKNDAPSTNGAVFLLPVHVHTSLPQLQMFINAMTRLIDTFVPMVLCRFHFLPMNKIDETLIPTAVQLVLHNQLASDCVVTVGSTPQEFFNKLRPFGLSKEGLPVFLGGSFNLFTPSQQEATYQMGRPMPFHGMGGIPTMAYAQRHSPTVSIHPQRQNDTNRVMPRDGADAQVQLESTLKRKAAALIPLKGQKATKKLKTLKALPQGEQLSLEDRLLDQPILLAFRKPAAVVPTGTFAGQEGGSTPENPEDLRKEYIKKRNALYSRRKYIKKKIEIEVLGKQSQILTAQNASLKKEHERLEKLVRKAKAVIQKRTTTTGHDKKMPPAAPLLVQAFHAVHRPLSNNSSSDKKLPPSASLPMEKKASSAKVHFQLTSTSLMMKPRPRSW